MVETHLNMFDVIVFTIVGLSALFSFYRGFVREFLSLFTWIGAFIITIYAFPHVNAMLMKQMDSELVANLISGVGTYLTTLILLSIFTSMVSKFVKQGKEVGALDNFLGLIFGVLRGLLIVGIGFLGISTTFEKQGYPDYVKEAISKPYVEKVSEVLLTVAPEYLKAITPKKEGESSTADVPDTTTESRPSEGDNRGYQWDSMDKLQQLIDEKSNEAE